MPPVSAAIPFIPSCCGPSPRPFSPDALFSLFECLAVLVHLRKLAHPAIQLDDAEEELLFQFEHSGEWLPDDLTLVAHWYWRAPAVLLGS